MTIQRIRDPLHDLIEFDTHDEVEKVIWELLQSRPFQRLRRVKQLGFSELVYPGATHTRFAHSVGVFHTARELMKIVRKKAPDDQGSREKVALAAALVHDVGHGPFSHAFEAVGERLELDLVDHEEMSDKLIRDGEITKILDDGFQMTGFASNVANMIKKNGRTTLHNSVVSSQFDADRLDYMQRDRMMTGSKHSAIDLTWLFANLEFGEVRAGVDNVEFSTVPTFVIGSKSIQAAEAYVLGLFQLYPTIYFHKATRGAEKIYTEILVRIVTLVKEDSIERTGLPSNHPLIKFGRDPESVETLLLLDDAVIYGALPLLVDSKDELLSKFAARLLQRRLLKCFDIRNSVSHKVDPHNRKEEEHVKLIEKCCVSVMLELNEWENGQDNVIPNIILDEAERNPYKPGGGKHGPREQITVCTEGGEFIDISQRSEIVKSLSVYKLNRAYFDSYGGDVEHKVNAVIEDVVQRETV